MFLLLPLFLRKVFQYGATRGIYSWWRYRRDEMKKIGILCATAKEVHPYLSTSEIKKASEYAMHCFCNGLIAGTEVVAVYSGCGKINASITAQLLIDRYQVDAVIFSGIAGGMI
jgi:adenosylhomocysteine nucleosidase